MAHESLFYVVYGVGLFFLSVKKEFIKDQHALRIAWMNYIFAIFIIPVFTIIKSVSFALPSETRDVGNTVKAINFTDTLAIALSWAFVSISLFCFLKTFVPKDED